MKQAVLAAADDQEITEEENNMSEAQLHILQHSIGADEYGHIVRGGGRNYFVTGEGSDDYPHCMALVSAGLMTRRAGSAISGGDDIFHVTEAGRKYVAEHSEQPPKLTASQRRYQAYLDADTCMTFGEWLKCRESRACA
jgi:hypothetical protein